jgi:hypothetical protein
MPTPGDQLPTDLTTLARKVADLQRELRELRAARPLESATVGAGGLGISQGGRLYMATPAGPRMLDVGPITDPTWNNPDGTPQQAFFMRRQDGTLVLSVFSSAGSPLGQFLAVWDSSGNIIFSDDAVSGVGLARPYLPVVMGPAFDAGWDYWPRTTSGTFVELWSGIIYRQQPRIVVVVRTATDVSGTTGQVQLTVNGTAVGSPQATSFTVGSVTLGPFDLSAYGHMQQLPIAVTAKRTAGTGAVRASVYSAYTLQS